MKRQLEQDIAADRSLAFANTENDGTIALGAFADFEKDGTFLIVVERLVYEVATNGAIAVKAFVDYKTTSQSSPYYMGKGEIAREAYAHQTLGPKSGKEILTWVADSALIPLFLQPSILSASQSTIIPLCAPTAREPPSLSWEGQSL